MCAVSVPLSTPDIPRPAVLPGDLGAQHATGTQHARNVQRQFARVVPRPRPVPDGFGDQRGHRGHFVTHGRPRPAAELSTSVGHGPHGPEVVEGQVLAARP